MENINIFNNKIMGIDNIINESMKEWKVPGLALAIIANEQLIHSKAYGFRDPEKGLKMKTDTLCNISCITKTFTAMSLALLVDEDKLDIDKPIKYYIPYFKMQDPYITEHITARDLLLHRSGLPDHKWAMMQFNTRKEIVEHLQYLDLAYPFRLRAKYNDLMYVVLGHLVECITDTYWEQFVQERIFNVLNMANSYFLLNQPKGNINYAKYYCIKSDEITTIPFDPIKASYPDSIYPMCPAYGIISSANDMIKWLKLFLNNGVHNNKRIVSIRMLLEMQKASMGEEWDFKYNEFGKFSHGLGWEIWSYRGLKTVFHTGGYGSQLLFFPEQRLGIVYLSTLNNNNLFYSTIYNIVEYLLDMELVNWKFRKIQEKIISNNNKKQVNNLVCKNTVINGSLDQSKYCGIYENPAYGTILITFNGKHLLFNYNSLLEGILQHYDTDIYLYRFEIFITFYVNNKVKHLAIPFEQDLKEIVFYKIK